jgi:transcriptional regulator with XRE-family HTH domain
MPDSLQRLRVGAGLSQKALAARAGVAVGTIASIEGGGNTKPHPRTRKRIADALGVEVFAVAEFVADLPVHPPADRGVSGRDAR